MRLTKRTVVLTLTHLAALIVGLSVGYNLGAEWGVKQLVRLTDFGMAMSVYMRVEAERLDGTDATYQDALRNYASLMDNLSNRANDSTRNLYAYDKMISLVRLSALAEKRGDLEESNQLITQALTICSDSQYPYCSPEALRTRVLKLNAFLDSRAHKQ